ncbi:MAG: hypothetical protein J6Q94_09055 [Clostridia bacterium]|nr:hypothetical protein [Clostridia bacterium]
MNTVIENSPADIKTENEVTFLGKSNDCFFDEAVSDEVIARFQAAQTGDTVVFGYYAQSADKKAAELPIEWIVLDKQGPRMLLLSKYVLDTGAYNFFIPDSDDYDEEEENQEDEIYVPEDEYEYVYDKETKTFKKVKKIILKEPLGKWDISSLRAWLNRTFFDSDFIRTAFSDAEKNLIEGVILKNFDNPKHKTRGGEDTTDKIFILSNAQIRRYFPKKESRIAYPTPYAKANGVYCKKDGSCDWWVRTPGQNKYGANIVSTTGNLNSSYNCRYDFIGIRPALWINLDFNE